MPMFRIYGPENTMKSLLIGQPHLSFINLPYECPKRGLHCATRLF